MNAWEIYSYQHPGWPEPHPAVIVSHPDRVILKPEVTILLCSKPAGDAPGQSIAGIIPMIEQPRKRIAPLHPGAWQVREDFDQPLPAGFWMGKE